MEIEENITSDKDSKKKVNSKYNPLFLDLNNKEIFYEAIHKKVKKEDENEKDKSLDKRINNFFQEKQQ